MKLANLRRQPRESRLKEIARWNKELQTKHSKLMKKYVKFD